MGLMVHDTTGTQTDCPKPLSRKKLRQLMPHNLKNLSSNGLRRFGHKPGWKIWSVLTQKRQQRKDKRKLFEKKSLPDGTTYQLIPNAADLVAIKPTIFERLGSLFATMTKREQRKKAKG